MSIQPLSNVSEARARAERIRQGVQALVTWRADVLEAWIRRDDAVLGYPSWSDYIHGEFDMLPRLEKPERDALMRLLSEAGMPQRKIAQTTGVMQSTVSVSLSDRKRSPSARSGGTTWSKRVQTVSLKCPMADLTTEEVEELLGAAKFLRDYCQGELIRRNQ
jgi:hypothetical protein